MIETSEPHYSIVSRHLLQMVEFLTSSWENEVRMVDSPFNEDSMNINFFQGGNNFGRETTRKKGKNRDIYCYANLGVLNFERKHWPVPRGSKY